MTLLELFCDVDDFCQWFHRQKTPNKVFTGVAARGQCSLGWFYGFKLHPIINMKTV